MTREINRIIKSTKESPKNNHWLWYIQLIDSSVTTKARHTQTNTQEVALNSSQINKYSVCSISLHSWPINKSGHSPMAMDAPQSVLGRNQPASQPEPAWEYRKECVIDHEQQQQQHRHAPKVLQQSILSPRPFYDLLWKPPPPPQPPINNHPAIMLDCNTDTEGERENTVIIVPIHW